MTYECQKKIVEDIGSHYRLKGDNFWYERVIGPGPDIPLINIGPGSNPDPRIIGPSIKPNAMNSCNLEKIVKGLDTK